MTGKGFSFLFNQLRGKDLSEIGQIISQIIFHQRHLSSAVLEWAPGCTLLQGRAYWCLLLQSSLARGQEVCDRLNNVWQSFRKSHKTWLLQNHESCTLIWLQIGVAAIDKGCTKPDTRAYDTMLERDWSEWLKRWMSRKKNVNSVSLWSLHPRKGLLGKQLPCANSRCTQKHTLTQSLSTSSFLRGLLLKITHSIFSLTQSNSHRHRRACSFSHTQSQILDTRCNSLASTVCSIIPHFFPTFHQHSLGTFAKGN